jgi:diaminopimelate decarboxylase
MDFFSYRDGRLACEDIDLATLATHTGTPTYVYSAGTLALHYDRLVAAFRDLDPLICFSVKSCPNVHILRTLVERGSGLDVVSGGELHRARLAGCPMDKVVYAGVGKTDEEIRDALGFGAASDDGGSGGAGGTGGAGGGGGVPIFNIESEPEFQTIAGIARSLGVTATAALRVNPDVDPKTHAYTTTGKKETKFGVDLERARAFFRRFGHEKHLRLTGIHLHIGSPVSETGPYVQAVTKTLALIDELAAEGMNVDTLDLGGGFAADYQTGASPAASDYAAAIVPLLRDRAARARGAAGGGGGLRFILEPGRSIAANAGVLLTRVLYVKESGTRKFIVCDAGMNTLIRPALYGSFHFIWPVTAADAHIPEVRTERPALPGLEPCDVVGPLCESGDFLAKDRPLPPLARGDLLAVFGAGAYGMSMASRYNSHPLPAEVLIDGDRARTVRRRETYADITRHEDVADELAV